MKMDQKLLLLETAKFNMLKVFAYPWEIGAFFIRQIITLCFLAIFWFVVAKESTTVLSFRQLIAYFLVSSAVQNIIFSNWWPFGSYVYKMAKRGDLSNYLIKPVSTIPFLFFSYLGSSWMLVLYSIVSIIAGVFIVHPTSIINVLLFLVFLVLAFILSLSINIFLASISFYFTEIGGIKNSLNHVRKVFSGALIPLTLFPVFLRQVAMLSPFPLLAFTPTYVLQNTLPMHELLQIFAVSAVWSLGSFVLVMKFWKKALKHYEGVGI